MPIPYGRSLYRQLYRIEIMSGHPEDWRRIAVHHGGHAHTVMAAICLAAAVLFWTNEA